MEQGRERKQKGKLSGGKLWVVISTRRTYVTKDNLEPVGFMASTAQPSFIHSALAELAVYVFGVMERLCGFMPVHTIHHPPGSESI